MGLNMFDIITISASILLLLIFVWLYYSIRYKELILNVQSTFRDRRRDYPRIGLAFGSRFDIIELPTYKCVTNIPKRVFVNNSIILTVKFNKVQPDIDELFTQMEDILIDNKKIFGGIIKIPFVNKEVDWNVVIQKKKKQNSKEMEWEITIPYSPSKSVGEYCLELELLSAGFKIDGDKAQMHNFDSDSLTYSWNCYFPNSGNHTFGIKASAVTPDENVDLGIKEFNIDVVKVDHLTERQVWFLAGFAALFSGCLAVVELVHRLGLF